MTTYSAISIASGLTVNGQKSQMDMAPGQLPALNNIVNYFGAISGGNQSAVLTATIGRVQASGTFTFVSVIATDVLIVNGVSFTGVASGATGNQFNIGVDDTATAVNAAAAINASITALVTGVVTATSALGVVTVSAVTAGTSGNLVTISSPDTTVTASGARLTSGSNGTTSVLDFS